MSVRTIRPLPEAVINQIAAGEVIERPASIVKELVENALDAGAGRIDVEIDDGGISRIQVRDDGAGIARDELALALTRHCTSKIASAEDLPVLVTLGFRGEALAAIAAVADTTLVSRRADAVHGWRIAPQAGVNSAVPEPVPHPRGTTVLVQDLFARVPARRRFLKRAQTEAQHVIALLKRLAFCTPGVAFHLQVDGARNLQTPAARDAQSAARRLRSLFGAEFAEVATYVDTVLGDIRVAGWIAGPAHAHAQADLQMLAVNGRVIRDRQLLHAVRMAYEDRLPAGRHACFAFHLELPPDAVDVNVHPGKLEVRFRDLRAVHDVVHAAARQGLATSPATQYAMPWTGITAGLPAAHDAPRSVLTSAAGATVAPQPDAPAARTAAPDTTAVIAMLGARFALVAHASTWHLVDVAGLVEETLQRRLAIDGSVRPLLIPIRLECADERQLDVLSNRLAAARLETSALGPRVLALRALPRVLPAVEPRVFATALSAALLASGESGLANALAAAAAGALQPPPVAGQAAWLTRLRAAAEEAGVDADRHARELCPALLAGLFDARTA